jgi:phage baseplate assembly protein W
MRKFGKFNVLTSLHKDGKYIDKFVKLYGHKTIRGSSYKGSLSATKDIINSIKNLILTNHYERPFRPEVGSNIRRFLFDNIDSIIAARIEREIGEVITNFEPRVKISKVSAIPEPDENAYKVTLEFFVINSPNPITINFFLERIR